jgi:hypothetical protein
MRGGRLRLLLLFGLLGFNGLDNARTCSARQPEQAGAAAPGEVRGKSAHKSIKLVINQDYLLSDESHARTTQ